MSGPWSDISGANSGQYQPAAAASGTVYYRLMVRSTTCAAVAFTNVVSVIVNTGCSSRRPAGRAITEDIRVYPNHLTENSIKVEAETKGKVSVRLLNAEGRAIPVTVSQSGTNMMNVSLPGLHTKGM